MQVGGRPLSTRPSRKRPINSYDCSTDQSKHSSDTRNIVVVKPSLCLHGSNFGNSPLKTLQPMKPMKPMKPEKCFREAHPHNAWHKESISLP